MAAPNACNGRAACVAYRLEDYNRERPHSSLGYDTPAARWMVPREMNLLVLSVGLELGGILVGPLMKELDPAHMRKNRYLRSQEDRLPLSSVKSIVWAKSMDAILVGQSNLGQNRAISLEIINRRRS